MSKKFNQKGGFLEQNTQSQVNSNNISAETKTGVSEKENHACQCNECSKHAEPLQNQKNKDQKLFGFGKKESENEKKIKDLTETLQRLQAEFENYQKRSVKQNEEYKCFANAKLAEELLPVLDSLEQGIKHNKELMLLHEQLFSILKKNGLQKIIIEKGQAFDHDKMECLMQEKNEKLPDGTVTNILIEGYTLNGKILRLSKVSVNVLENENQNTDKKTFEKNNENQREKEQITRIDETVKKMESD